MIFEIKHRYSGAVLFSLECASLKVCLEAAVRSGSNLRDSDLRGSNLRGSDLRGSDLRGSNLRDSNLRGSNLRDSNLRGSDLSGSDLRGSNLSGSDLSGSNLRDSNLRGSDLSDAKGADYAIACTRILPEGALIGWKSLRDGVLCKVRIPEDAKRSNAFGRKCRAEFVDVIEGEGVSRHDGITKYAPGLRVTCDKWDEDYTQECSGGIHFFITKIEAENYT